jgi:hypothetical protein
MLIVVRTIINLLDIDLFLLMASFNDRRVIRHDSRSRERMPRTRLIGAIVRMAGR